MGQGQAARAKPAVRGAPRRPCRRRQTRGVLEDGRESCPWFSTQGRLRGVRAGELLGEPGLRPRFPGGGVHVGDSETLETGAGGRGLPPRWPLRPRSYFYWKALCSNIWFTYASHPVSHLQVEHIGGIYEAMVNMGEDVGALFTEGVGT